jgi:hypothetical protein
LQQHSGRTPHFQGLSYSNPPLCFPLFTFHFLRPDRRFSGLPLLELRANNTAERKDKENVDKKMIMTVNNTIMEHKEDLAEHSKDSADDAADDDDSLDGVAESHIT